MGIRRGTYLMAAVILLLFLTGCSYSDKKAIREVIQNYNQNLPLALVRSNPEIMKPFVGEREYVHISTFIMQNAAQRKVMDSRLKQLEITNLDLLSGGTKLSVQSPSGLGQVSMTVYSIAYTNEIWDYRYLDLETKKPQGQFKPVSYTGKYLMGKIRDKWVIELLEVESKK
ncbi:MAG TPA: hypothetical protein VHS59_11980 [Bacillota bacterium]|nr:hypothetical protein [Bacillota bacterium]